MCKKNLCCFILLFFAFLFFAYKADSLAVQYDKESDDKLLTSSSTRVDSDPTPPWGDPMYLGEGEARDSFG